MKQTEERKVSIYGDTLYYSSGGTAGTTYPIGTKDYPCSSLANLETIAAAYGIKKIMTLSDWTLNTTVTPGLTIISDEIERIITLNGQDIGDVSFRGLAVTGAQGAGTEKANFWNCWLNGATGVFADMVECAVYTISLKSTPGKGMNIINCHALDGVATLTINDPLLLSISNFNGILVIDTQTGGTTTIHINQGKITFNATCNGGNANLYGHADLTDLSTGTSINNYLINTRIGYMSDTATADDLGDLDTTSILAKLRRILYRFSANAFSSTINGVARTDVEAIADGLASYIVASGAAPSKKVNNQTLRTNLEQILQDFFAVVGCDNTNTFSVTAQGAAQTVLDNALYALAQYFATNGAAISATVNPGGSARATLELILEDFADMLAGSTGIITWPGSVKYGNNVSLAEALAYVSDTVDTISAGVSEGTLDIIEDTGGSSTTITASEITQGANFWKGALLLSTSGNNDGQTRPVVASAVGSVTVFPAFDGAVVATDTFTLISTWRPDVWNQQDDVAVTFNVTNVAADVLDLSVAGFSYSLNHLRLKFADPGAQTITVTLYELINDVATAVDTFTVDTTNYTTYHSLMDMFGVSHITGNDIRIAAVASDAGPYACTGQYQYALARTS